MWKNTTHYAISVEEREMFKNKLEELCWSYGHKIKVLTRATFSAPSYMAYLEVHGNGEAFNLVCGTFWNQEDNILPLIAMTHELGHYIDITENFNSNLGEYHSLGTFEFETRAWEIAFGLCEKLGLLDKYRKEVFQYARQCIHSYYTDLWTEFVNFETFQNSMKRFMKILGLEEEPEQPNLGVTSLLDELLAGVEEVKVPVKKKPKKSPLELKKEREREWQRHLKKSMGMKDWEL